MVVMIYRILIFILLFSACQRKTMPVHEDVTNIEIDTSLTLLAPDELPEDALADIHHLLKLGYEKAHQDYDSIRFQMYFDPKLKDSIRIQASGKDTIFLTIGNDQNKKVALYSFLDILGFRFYGPEDHWTYISAIQNFKQIDTLIFPFFPLRQWSPTFSIGPKRISGFNKPKQLYSRWGQRLRKGSSLNLVHGHYGSTFNRKYKEEIIANPEWRGKDGQGQVRPWSSNIKLCYSNPEVVRLFKKDAKERLERMINSQTPPYYVNMEPPDGGGFCECKSCKKEVSDQVYGLANEVAFYLRQLNKDAHAWLIAYNQHSTPPSFTLEDNILVGLVPFGFQKNYSPHEFMKIWENFHSALFLRDYLAIPQWHFDQPAWQNGEQFLNRIQHLKSKGYYGYNFETTSSYLSAGWPIYLISMNAWKKINYQESLHQFQNRMFPSSQLDIEQLIEYFAEAGTSSYYFGNLKKLIEDAKGACTDPQELLRINDISDYFQYLVLRNKYQTSTGQEKSTAKDHLLNYIYADSSQLTLHSWGLYRSMVKNMSKIPFGEIIPIDKPQKTPEFTLRSRKPRILGYSAMHPGFHPSSIDSFPIIRFNNNPGSIVYVPEGKDLSIKLQIKNIPSNSNGYGRVSFMDMDGVEIDNIIIVNANREWNTITFTAPAGDAFYKLKFSNPAAWMYLKGPDRPFAFTDPLDTGVLTKSVKLWTYIPNKFKLDISFKYLTRNVIIRKNQKITDEFFVRDPINKNIIGEGVYSIQTTKASYESLNLPHLFSLSEDQVIRSLLK